MRSAAICPPFQFVRGKRQWHYYWLFEMASGLPILSLSDHMVVTGTNWNGESDVALRCKIPGELVMRNVLLLLATFVVAAFAWSQPAAAAGRYCLQGRIWGYPGNCQFMTYEQCAISASGTDAYCGINPRYAFAREGYRYHRHYRNY